MITLENIKQLKIRDESKSIFDNRGCYLEFNTDNIKEELIGLGLNSDDVERKINCHYGNGNCVHFTIDALFFSVWQGNTTKWTITRLG